VLKGTLGLGAAGRGALLTKRDFQRLGKKNAKRSIKGAFLSTRGGGFST